MEKKQCKIGAIIRGVGERTQKLCEDSLLIGVSAKNVWSVKNVSPFLETLRKGYEIAIANKLDWCLFVDADMIMVENWKDLLLNVIDEVESNERIWEFTFRLKDSIEGRNIDALHVVRGKFLKELLTSVDSVIDGLKPEGRVRDDMIKRTGAKRKITRGVIAYHGYEQYAKDIFNRFYNRACRDASYAKKHKLFHELNTEDKRIAKAGWDYGIKHTNLETLDSREKVIDMTQFGFTERAHIRFKLDRFYKRVG